MITYELISKEVEKKIPKGIVFRTITKRQPFNPFHDNNLTCIGKAVAFNEKDEATFHIITVPEFEKYIKENA